MPGYQRIAGRQPTDGPAFRPCETIPASPAASRAEPQASTQVAALDVRMSRDVFFDRGSSALSPRGASKIAEVAEVLRQNPRSDVHTRGVTSSEEDDPSHFELSQRRAEVARNDLIAQGVPD